MTPDRDAEAAPTACEKHPAFQVLFAAYRSYDCTGTVDPLDPEDCAGVAAESVRVLLTAGMLTPAIPDGPYDRLIAAFQIFKRYPHEGGMEPGHDVLWAGPAPQDVSDVDLAVLAELGWLPDHRYDCFQKNT